jgi:hypothetical protein
MSALAYAQPLADGQQIDGITCQAGEQVLFHIHAHLTIFVDGAPRRVPAGIGIAPPLEVDETPVGAFVAGAPCFMWLHTHSADGIIHTESPVNRTYTLGEFFDIWGQPLSRHGVGPTRGLVTAFQRHASRATTRIPSSRTHRSSSTSGDRSSPRSTSPSPEACEDVTRATLIALVLLILLLAAAGGRRRDPRLRSGNGRPLRPRPRG